MPSLRAEFGVAADPEASILATKRRGKGFCRTAVKDEFPTGHDEQ
jgi:hypothetical protein